MNGLATAAAGRLAFFASVLGICSMAAAARGENAPAARVTRVFEKATITLGPRQNQPARPGDALPDGAVVETLGEARLELALPGASVARLGGKSVLSLGAKARALELAEGLALWQVARRAPAITLRTGALQVAARGSTGLIERNGKAYVKILVLEGQARVYTKRLGESVLVSAGQLLITSPTAQGLPEPVHFAIEQLYQTSLLLNSGFAPLPSRAAMWQAMQKQKRDPQFVPTNLIIYGRGTLVNLLPPNPTPTPSPP